MNRRIRAAARAASRFVLSLSVVIVVLLPAPAVAAAAGGSDLEQPCISLQPPCPLGQTDEQTAPSPATIAALDEHEGRIRSLAPALEPSQSPGRSGQKTHLRLHRLLL